MKCSFEEFKEDVHMGREIEFIYKELMYFVTYDKRGWLLIRANDKTSQCFTTPDELLENAQIDNRYLFELWDEVDVDTVY